MGMPVVAEEEDDEVGDDDGPKFDRSKLASALERSKKKDEVPEEAGGEAESNSDGASDGLGVSGETTDDASSEPDDSTRQVAAADIQSALGGMAGDTGDVDSDAEAASAWGLAESSASDAGGATEVVDPDELDFSDDAVGDFSVLDDSTPATDTADDEPEQEQDQPGTLSGMSADELQPGEDSSTGGRMQAGGEESTEGDVSTQALSPDQLAQIDEMGFGAESDSTSEDDDEKTAVLDSPAQGGNFQLRKPTVGDDPDDLQEPDADSGSSSTSDEATKADTTAGDDPPDQRKSRDTPRSGVFRAAGQVTKRKSKSSGADDSGPDSANLEDTGVTGTGTYSMSNTDSGSSTESLGDGDDRLSIGGVGSGGDTAFPAGLDDESDSDRVKEPVEASAPSEPESDAGDGVGLESSTGPASDSGPDSGALDAPSTGPQFPVADSRSSKAPTTGPESSRPEAAAGAKPVDDAAPADTGTPAMDDGSTSAIDAEPSDRPTSSPDLATDPMAPETDQGAGESTGRPSSEPEPLDFGGKPGPVEESRVGDEPVTDAPAVEPEPMGEFGGVEKPATSPAATEGPAAGSPEPRQSTPASARPPEENAPQPSGRPKAGAGESAPTASPAASDAAPAPAETAAASQNNQSMSITKIVELLQRGFGALGALSMVAMTVVAVVFDGVPTGIGVGVMAAAVILAVVAVVVTVVPLNKTMRGIGYGGTGVISIIGFAATLVVGVGAWLAVALFFGGGLLLFAAIFPWFEKLIEE